MRSVLVVDDQKIRLAAFQEAEKLFKKMHRIESDLDSFQSQDQRRFEAWSSLTFREINNQVLEAQAKMYRLHQIHNWMVALSRMKKISAAKAFRQIKKEENRYSQCSEAEKRAIDEARRKREDFIRDELLKENRRDDFDSMDESFDSSYAEEIDSDQDRSEQADEDQFWEFDRPQGPPRSKEEERVFRHILGMSEEELNDICEDLEEVFFLFDLVGRLQRSLREMLPMLRIWVSLPKQQQGPFAKKFRRVHGAPIEPLISELMRIRDDLARTERKFASRGRSSKKQRGQGWDDFSSVDAESSRTMDQEGLLDEISNADSNANPNSINYISEQEQLKMIYRKLVRRLHPDMQSQNQGHVQNQNQNQNQNAKEKKNPNDRHKKESAEKKQEVESAWRKQMWGRVQECYKDKDLKGLTKLFQMTLLRTGALRDLTLTEIEESANWLRQELAILQGQAAAFKKMPAWGFSRKKDLAPLIRKIEKSYQKDLKAILLEIKDLEYQHFILEHC
ncbi:MAG: hypothetical protein JNM39_02950 [Bdellovibrionaceae bacterium]|nr:hypothetical protein [Pseudobdellovibrionaceae bacterium]